MTVAKKLYPIKFHASFRSVIINCSGKGPMMMRPLFMSTVELICDSGF